MTAKETTKRISIAAAAVTAVFTAYFGGAYVQSQTNAPPFSSALTTQDLELALAKRDAEMLKAMDTRHTTETKKLIEQFEQRFSQIASDQRMIDARIDAIRDRYARVEVMATDIAWIRETVNELKAKKGG